MGSISRRMKLMARWQWSVWRGLWGGMLMLTTEEEERDMALATVITQMCQTFADFLQEEDQENA